MVTTIKYNKSVSQTAQLNPILKGVEGTKWYNGTEITGADTSGQVFSSSGIAVAKLGDFYLNTSTGNYYKCSLAGVATIAKWRYQGCLKGDSVACTIYTGTITTTWNGDVAPYSQVINIGGVLSTDYPLVDVVQSGIELTDREIRVNWNRITRIVSGNGQITVYANKLTEADIPIQLLVWR